MKILIGVVCDFAGIAPATALTFSTTISDLIAAGHETTLQIEPHGGQPDVSRSLLATRAVTGRYDVLLLIDSGAAAASGVADLCVVAYDKKTIAGTMLPPVLQHTDHVQAVSSSLTAYSISALDAVAKKLPRCNGFIPFFIPSIEKNGTEGVFCISGWRFCLIFSALTRQKIEVLPAIEAYWATPGSAVSKRTPPEPPPVNPYPELRLPLKEYVEKLKTVSGGLKPSTATGSLSSPPSAITWSRERRGENIKVALVNTCMLAGGAERQTCTLACGLDRDRYDPIVVNAHPQQGAHAALSDMLRDSDIPLYHGADHPEIDKADVVVWWGPSIADRLLSGECRQQNIHVAHSDSHWTASTIAKCRDHITKVVAVSGPSATVASDAFGKPAPVIWNGIDAAELELVNRQRDGDAIVLGYLGRLSDEKNIGSIVAAMKKLPPNFTLKIWGAGPLEDFLRAAIDAEQLSRRVTLMGVADNPADAYAQMDVLVLASLFEGLPLTVIEAMFARIPVIAPPWGDLPLVLGDGRGTICEPWPTPLSVAIQHLTEQMPCNYMRKAAYDFASKNFTAKRMVDSYSAMIEEAAWQS